MARLARVVALKALVFVLALPLMAASGLPAMVRALGGGPAHHCTCPIRHGHDTCACPTCHPDDARYRTSREAIRGRCGDDDGVSTAKPALLGVPVASVLDRVAVGARVRLNRDAGPLPDPPVVEPPTRPPMTRAS